jgi:hypothetical protein
MGTSNSKPKVSTLTHPAPSRPKPKGRRAIGFQRRLGEDPVFRATHTRHQQLIREDEEEWRRELRGEVGEANQERHRILAPTQELLRIDSGLNRPMGEMQRQISGRGGIERERKYRKLPSVWQVDV